jgi:hypothetical protein
LCLALGWSSLPVFEVVDHLHNDTVGLSAHPLCFEVMGSKDGIEGQTGIKGKDRASLGSLAYVVILSFNKILLITYL